MASDDDADDLATPVARAKEELVQSKQCVRDEVGPALAALRIDSARQVEDARTLIRDLGRTLAEDAPPSHDTAARCASASERLAAVHAERADLLARRTALERGDDGAAARRESRRLEHAASLYESITGITWDHQGDDDTIGGVIAYEHLQTAKRFSLPTARRTPADLADALWTLVDYRSSPAT